MPLKSTIQSLTNTYSGLPSNYKIVFNTIQIIYYSSLTKNPSKLVTINRNTLKSFN